MFADKNLQKTQTKIHVLIEPKKGLTQCVKNRCVRDH